MVRVTKPTDPYVRFYIENGTEVATMTAADFRAAMLERDHEIVRLKELYGAAMDSLNRCDAKHEQLRLKIARCKQHGHFSGGCPCNCHDVVTKP